MRLDPALEAARKGRWHSPVRSYLVLAELPYLGCNSTLGCELQFVQTDTHQVLADPIQSKLRANHCYYVIAQQCFVEVHLPETVVSLLHGAFSRCQVLRVVTAPGCKYFGAKVFEECCSLTQIGVTQCPANILAPQAQLRPRVFQGCTALHHLNLGTSGCGPAYPNRSLPDCCFLEAGIVALFLPLQILTLKFWAQLLHIAHSCSNSASPAIYESLSKKPFSSVPRCKKSASHHPCCI